MSYGTASLLPKGSVIATRLPGLLRIAFSGIVVLACTEIAFSQNYHFQVKQMDLEVHVLPDASTRLEYKIVFENSPSGRAIDIVDIGLPHGDYRISSMSASIDGRRLSTIRKSEYIDVGVEVSLGGHAIQPGDQGIFRFTCTMPEMVYQDTTDDERASLQIKPTWFDPQLQLGRTHLRMAVHLPPGIQPEEVRYHDEATRYRTLTITGEGEQAHVAALWEWQNHLLSKANPKIGISFPKQRIAVVRITKFDLLLKWFRESTEAQWFSGLILLAAFAFLFFRFSGGTGCVVFGVLVVIGLVLLRANPLWHFWLWPLVASLIGVNEWYRRKKTSQYLPALATIEGGGIKRGLTAPQAAILLELPLEKILALVLFGLLKKKVIRVTANDPLRVAVDSRFAVEHAERRKLAGQLGIVLHEYEHWFIQRLIGWDEPVAQRDMSKAVGKLVKSTAATMRGFDLSDTQDYYRRIVARAWQEAELQVDLGKRTATVDRNVEWMLLDPDADGRFTTWHTGGYDYHPTWFRSSSSSSAPAPASGPPSSSSQTSLSEVAGSFAGWMENTAGGLVEAIEPASLGLALPSGQVMDFSGIDRVTGEVFEALAKSRGSGGGGGGGGCACACAGCACACACAGGGR